jgi:hypothetical protein
MSPLFICIIFGIIIKTYTAQLASHYKSIQTKPESYNLLLTISFTSKPKNLTCFVNNNEKPNDIKIIKFENREYYFLQFINLEYYKQTDYYCLIDSEKM